MQDIPINGLHVAGARILLRLMNAREISETANPEARATNDSLDIRDPAIFKEYLENLVLVRSLRN